MKSSGKHIVLFLVGVSFLAAVGTFWNYSRAVFSTNHATLINSSGRVEALFPPAITAKLHPHQQAKVTFRNLTNRFDGSGDIFQAEIMTVVKGGVLLQLLEKPKEFSPGEACDVTVDTTIPEGNYVPKTAP